MATRAEPNEDFRNLLGGVRESSRSADLVWKSIGVLTYSVVLWVLAFSLVPMAFGWAPTVVGSGSMNPVVREGDVVLASPHSGEGLGPGTVIVFSTDATRTNVMHRIVAVNPDGTYVTKGDANPASDSSPVHPSEVRGVARVLVPYAGLPAHWMRTGNWAGVAGFAGVITLAVWLAHRRPRRRVAPESEQRFRRWATAGAVTMMLVGATGATALAL